MKRLIIITSILFLSSSLFISCTTNEGDNPDRLTARGKTMTDEWENVTNFIMNCYADIPFRLNSYIENELDTQNTNKNIWDIFVNGKVAYTINTYGQPLDSIGAKWELTSFANYTYIGLHQDDFSVNFNITCIDTNSWNIYSINKDIPEFFFNVNITCENTPKTLIDYPYLLSGEGNLSLSPNYYYESLYESNYDIGTSYSSDETRYNFHYPTLEQGVSLHFETEDDLQKTSYYHWSKGSVNITALNREGETSSTRAVFFRRGLEYVAEITYGGITEEWPGYGYCYYE